MFQAMTNSLVFFGPWLGELSKGTVPFYRLTGWPNPPLQATFPPKKIAGLIKGITVLTSILLAEGVTLEGIPEITHEARIHNFTWNRFNCQSFLLSSALTKIVSFLILILPN